MRERDESDYDEVRDLYGPKGGWCKVCIARLKRRDCGGTGYLIVGRVRYRGRVHIAKLAFDPLSAQPRRLRGASTSFCGKVGILI